MKILIIEATAEELRANRTVLDNVNEVLNRFTDSLVGVNNIDYAKVLASINKSDEESEEESEEEKNNSRRTD